MKIVFLDVKTIGEDIDLSYFDALGEIVKYPFSTPEEALERTKDADVIVLNKVEINEASIGKGIYSSRTDERTFLRKRSLRKTSAV